MKRTATLTLALVLIASVGTALAGGEGGKTTIEGELVSAKCYLRTGLTGNDHMGMENCGTMCAKDGNPVGLLTTKGKYYPLVVPSPQIADHIGDTMRATGTMKAGSMVPDKLEVKEGDSWKAVEVDLT